jgi:hypothetical protein
MGIIAFDVNQTWDFSLLSDVSEPKTIFHLAHLDSALTTYLMDSVADYKMSDRGKTGSADIQFNVFQRDRELVRYGVKGWENLNREDGTPTEPKFRKAPVGGKVGVRSGLSDESLDLLIPYFADLARAIEDGNKLTETEIKNS